MLSIVLTFMVVTTIFFIPGVFFICCLRSGQPVNKISEKNPAEKGFWRKQFSLTGTESQNLFDWIFGIFLPLICIAFDPIVFNEGGIIEDYKWFAYTLSATSIMALAAWLLWGAKLKSLSAVLGGLFAVGGLVSLGIGIVLVPVSFIGLVVAVGALGFTPLLTAIVYLRNVRRTFAVAGNFIERKTLIYIFATTAIFSAAIPVTINREVNYRKEIQQNESLMRISDNFVTESEELPPPPQMQRRSEKFSK